ncbi:MAG TPA: hypothetical protein VMR89_09125 [Actinomycetota bacterium]|nr:hypothetical protein [Actinomycetota bacterium]
MNGEVPPGRAGALMDRGGAFGVAAVGGAVAFAALVAVCQVLAQAQHLLFGAFGLWSWAKIGLLTALLSLRADVVGTVQGSPALRFAAESTTLRWRLVPMVLTIGFLWLAARAGRRAARARQGGHPLIASGLAAAGAAIPVVILAAVCSSLVTLVFHSLGLRLEVDVLSGALWAGGLAAVGAGTGAYLEATGGRAAAAVLRGGLTAYGGAIGLLVVGVFVLATLEPTVTRAYVDEVNALGAPGGALLSLHLLGLPAQSALLLAPASGSCLEIVGDGPMFDLCPWRLAASGPAGDAFFPAPLALSPSFWLLSAVPAIAAMLGGRRAVSEASVGGRRALGLGLAAGSVFALLVVIGAWFAAPVLTPIVVPVQISINPAWSSTAITALIWGAGGGVFGAWLAARRYAEPELPRPTSA